jgi:hypothetical protein
MTPATKQQLDKPKPSIGSLSYADWFKFASYFDRPLEDGYKLWVRLTKRELSTLTQEEWEFIANKINKTPAWVQEQLNTYRQ